MLSLKTILLPIVAAIVVALLLTGCDSSKDSSADESTREIRLWVAPNEAQEAFWLEAVSRWNDSGLGLRVNFTTIPATGNSEETILTALVSGNAPDMTTNVFSGFAAQLAGLDQLVDLSTMQGFDQLIASRSMETIIDDWDQAGRKYVLPIYSSPTLIWWRQDLLEKLGVNKAPSSFQDVFDLSEKYSVPNKQFGMKVIAGRNWADRWFDFISYYNASSDGAPYIEDGKVVYDNAAGRATLRFVQTMFENGWTSSEFGDEPLVSGEVLGAAMGPWNIVYYKNTYPEIMKKIIIGPMVGEKTGTNKTYTFADTKGLVLFKHSRVQEQAFEFVSWIFSNDELSLLWLEETGLPPARGDLLVNPIFESYFQRQPLAAKYAEYVDVAVPPAFIETTIEVQKAMGVEMLEPIEFHTKDIDTAMSESVERINKLLIRYQKHE
jgi:multiple sugar transport system substrate-binding protein